MRVTYVGMFPEVVVPYGNREYFCAQGATIEVPEELGKSLLEQPTNWQTPAPAKPEKITKENI